MNIKANELRPKITIDDVDVYLPRGVRALEVAGKNPRGLFRIFQRHEGAAFFGLEEYLSALASLVGQESAAETIVYAVPEGHTLTRHETAMTLEGPARALMVNETLLHYLSTGTRFRTLAREYPGNKYPWVFMGARYLAPDDLAIATRALSEEGILSTVPRWADRFIGTESHSQIAMWAGLKLEEEVEAAIAGATKDAKVAATIRATVAFHRANPEVPLFVLGDFAARTVGCFEVFKATAMVCANLNIELAGGRMDISRADLSDRPIVDAALKEQFDSKMDQASRFGYWDNDGVDPLDLVGMNPKVVQTVRQQLDEIGLTDFKLVVSSGIKLEDVSTYVDSGASIVGIGEEAAYFLNKGECNFTSDAIGYFEDERLVPFAKEGRELERTIPNSKIRTAVRGVKIAKATIRHNLADYL